MKKQELVSRKKTTNIKDVRDSVLEIADSVRNMYFETKDMRAANIAIRGYNSAVHATVAEIQYKRATGKLKDITFMNDNIKNQQQK